MNQRGPRDAISLSAVYNFMERFSPRGKLLSVQEHTQGYCPLDIAPRERTKRSDEPGRLNHDGTTLLREAWGREGR